MVTTTTEYGTWTTHSGSVGELTIGATVVAFLGDFAGEYDVDAIVDVYRTAINDALPEGVSLHGDTFYGPYPRRDDADIHAAVESVDLMAIAERHDLAAE